MRPVARAKSHAQASGIVRKRMTDHCGKLRRVIGQSGFGSADLLLLKRL